MELVLFINRIVSKILTLSSIFGANRKIHELNKASLKCCHRCVCIDISVSLKITVYKPLKSEQVIRNDKNNNTHFVAH